MNRPTHVQPDGAITITVMNNSQQYARTANGQRLIFKVTDPMLANGTYPVTDNCLDPTRRTNRQEYRGKVIYVNKSHVFQIGDVVNGTQTFVRHGVHSFRTPPVEGRRYEVIYDAAYFISARELPI